MEKIIDVIGMVKSVMPVKVNDKPVYTMAGSPLEILDRLTEMDGGKNTKYKKYPLIMLLHDIEENRNPRPGVYADLTDLKIIIANNTERHYSRDQRYEINFLPILYPIYQQMLHNLALSGYFGLQIGEIPHRKTDRLFWGRNGLYGKDGNIFNDLLDAIEIRNLNLFLNKQNCIKWENLIK